MTIEISKKDWDSIDLRTMHGTVPSLNIVFFIMKINMRRKLT